MDTQGSFSCLTSTRDAFFTQDRCFYFDIRTGEPIDAFSITSGNILTGKDFAQYWPDIEEADRAELKAFVINKMFCPRYGQQHDIS